MTEDNTAIVVIFFCLLLSIYLIPGIIALSRKHPSVMAIFAVNIFFGWTLLGWVIAFIWSLTATKQNVMVSIQRDSQDASTKNSRDF